MPEAGKPTSTTRRMGGQPAGCPVIYCASALPPSAEGVVTSGEAAGAGGAVRLGAALLLALSPTACVAGGYSSDRGFFLWPGSIVLTVVLVLLFLYMRRRR